MPNMPHCRFSNTVADLADCYKHLDDETLSDAEFSSMLKLVQFCAKVVQATVGIGDPEFKNELAEWVKNEKELRQESKEKQIVS